MVACGTESSVIGRSWKAASTVILGLISGIVSRRSKEKSLSDSREMDNSGLLTRVLININSFLCR